VKQLAHVLRAFPAMLRVGFADALAYRAEFLVWVLAYTMPIIMLALWTAVAREAPVGRFGEREFQAYFLATLVVRLATGAWVIWDMNMEVRQGTLQKRLLRPMHPIVTYLAENMAAVPMRIVVVTPITVLSLAWVGLSALSDSTLQLCAVPLSLLGAFLLNFFSMASIGALALYFESSIAAFELWLGLYTVLSGYVMPLEFFPAYLRPFIDALPFRQMLAFPVENLLGLSTPAQTLQDLGLQWGYAAAFAVLAFLLWRGGVKRYAAFGG
jgi:ABC-2 type transport system permease protein